MVSTFTLIEEAGPVKILARRLRSGLASSGPELGGKLKCSRVFRMYHIIIPKREGRLWVQESLWRGSPGAGFWGEGKGKSMAEVTSE